MKKCLLIGMAVAAFLPLTAFCNTSTNLVKEAEVYIHIPGNAAVHTLARVEYKTDGIVVVETPWGVRYTTHLANVVIVERKYGKMTPPPKK